MAIIGHQKQWQFLKQIAQENKPSRALLFSGPGKVGKKKVAFEFIKLICGKDFFIKEQPDFNLIEPENQEIRISRIKELTWKLSLKPYSAPIKTAIIDEAHCLNQEAQNALLKTLEEPKGETLLILITERPEALFSTIISRCENLKFYPVKNFDIEKYLKSQGCPEEKITEISKFSLGRPGAAIDFFHSPKKLEDQKKIVSKLAKLIDTDLFFRFQYAKELAEDSLSLREVLESWLDCFRDALLEKIKGRETFKGYSLAKIKQIINLVQSTNFLISTTNVNRRLALETLLMEL